MTDAAQAWDRAAPDYQRVYRLGLNDYNARLLRFWEESGMLFPGARVLDIGCGVGKYGAFAFWRAFSRGSSPSAMS